MADEKTIKQFYCECLCNPAEWSRKADGLLDVASMLRPTVEGYWKLPASKRAAKESVVATHLLICGLAIENLLKAVVLAERGDELRDEVNKTSKLPQVLRTHNIPELCKLVRFELANPDESILWERLTRTIEWDGRYPAPTKAMSFPAQDVFGLGGDYIAIGFHTPSDLPNMDVIVEALRNRLSTIA